MKKDEVKKLLDLAQASSMLNTIKGIQDGFCSRFHLCNGCPITPERCVSYEINEATRRIDYAYFVNRDLWFVDCVLICQKLMSSREPAYAVKLGNGTLTELSEKWLFSSKRDAVGEIIRQLKGRIGEHRQAANHLQGILDNFQSANFQMRYMGEVIE